jgi:hypothetical protein
VYLNELAPAGFKAFFPGFVYQLGVMVSSPYTYLEVAYGDSHLIDDNRPDYGTGMAIVLVSSCVFTCLLLAFSVSPIERDEDVAGSVEDVKLRSPAPVYRL